MTKTYLRIAALALALAPGVAAAQSALPDFAVPGSGYKIPEVHRTEQQPLSAYEVNPAVPGDGYHITAAASPTAPAAPAMTQNGSYPSHFNQ